MTIDFRRSTHDELALAIICCKFTMFMNEWQLLALKAVLFLDSSQSFNNNECVSNVVHCTCISVFCD